MSIAQLCARLESLAWRDLGGRSSSALRVPGDLLRAATFFANARAGILILTGFPCRVACSPPGETDGPSGAVALAFAARSLGLRASVATDANSASALRAALDARGLFTADVPVESFIARGAAGYDAASEETRARFAALLAAHDVSVAVERAGASADGHFYTMRGIDMEGLVAPLEELLVSGTRAGGETATLPPRACIGIGDGGNECGMGAVRAAVEATVPRGPLIAAVAAADATLLAGVSNWGAWALVAAVDARMGRDGALLPTTAGEEAIERALEMQGVGDGVNGCISPPGSVDGMPAQVHRAVLSEIRETLAEFRRAPVT